MFPMGQAGATWWNEVGMTNISALVRRVKSGFNIDDDQVYLGGFSDGGSAGFLFAMTLPTDFAAFMALNGHMGVGSEDGGLPTYATNLFNSPIFATTTDRDQLYPTSMMERSIAMAEKAGAKIHYKRMKGEHSFDDQSIALRAGSTIRIPAGVKHNLANTGPDVLTCLIAFSSGTRETVFLE